MDEALAKFEKWEKALHGAESQYKALDSQTKTILARGWGTEGSVKDKENSALKSVAYVKHLDVVNTAREKFLECRSYRDFYRTKWEHERSLLSASKKIY